MTKRKRPIEVLTPDEVKALMSACSKRAPTGKRDRALICLLWRGQLRISEALSLKPSDFDPEQGTLRILHGKGDKSRVVAIDDQAADILNHWLAVRAKLGFTGHKPIFCTLKGGPIYPSFYREKLPRLARKAGITKRVHAHGLRHSGASQLAQEGISLIDIQHQLGHSTPTMTDRYLQQINPTARLQRVRSLTW